MVVDESVHKFRSWATAIGVLAFTILQIFVLASVVDGLGYELQDNNNDVCGIELDAAGYVVIAFLSLLWMLPIIQDIEEASTEENVMNYHLQDSVKGSAEVVRLSLRIRRYMQPGFATAATIALIMNDEGSSKNLILNFLAIGFISEADNIIAIILLTTDQRTKIKNTINNIDHDTFNARPVFLWNRLHGFLYAIILFLCIHDTKDTEYCFQIADYIQQYVLYLPPMILFAVIFCHSLVYILLKEINTSRCKRFLDALIHCLCNLIAYALMPLIFFSSGKLISFYNSILYKNTLLTKLGSK